MELDLSNIGCVLPEDLLWFVSASLLLGILLGWLVTGAWVPKE